MDIPTRVCYLDCRKAGHCCYLVIHIENLLSPLQLFYLHLWPIFWFSLIYSGIWLLADLDNDSDVSEALSPSECHPWRGRRQVPSKRWQHYTRLYGVTSYKRIILTLLHHSTVQYIILGCEYCLVLESHETLCGQNADLFDVKVVRLHTSIAPSVLWSVKEIVRDWVSRSEWYILTEMWHGNGNSGCITQRIPGVAELPPAFQ
jgi:hypothetical protein